MRDKKLVSRREGAGDPAVRLEAGAPQLQKRSEGFPICSYPLTSVPLPLTVSPNLSSPHSCLKHSPSPNTYPINIC